MANQIGITTDKRINLEMRLQKVIKRKWDILLSMDYLWFTTVDILTDLISLHTTSRATIVHSVLINDSENILLEQAKLCIIKIILQ